MNKRDIKRGLEFIRMGCAIVANDAKAHNLELFNQSQQRIKARHSQAQNTDNTIASKITIEVANERLKWANSFERPLILIELYSLMNRQEWFKLFTKEWSGCDGCYRIKKELSLILDTNLTEMMTAASEEAMTTWQSLPDELTVYRGCYKNNKKGLSWTLDKNTALQFPTFNRYKQKGQALLLTGKVKKTDGLLFVDRKESEILSSRVVVISTEVIRENEGANHV